MTALIASSAVRTCLGGSEATLTRLAHGESQISALRERAIAEGHQLLPGDVYTDDGFSGATLVRPALERLRDRIAEGSIDILYVHNPDRLARRYAVSAARSAVPPRWRRRAHDGAHDKDISNRSQVGRACSGVAGER